MSKYESLKGYLLRISVEEDQHTISFDEIENLLGISLPLSARNERPWWANTRANTHAVRWLDAGWKVFRVDFGKGQVTFVRTGDRVKLLKPTQNRYENLRIFFQAMPQKQEQIALTFEEFGILLGHKLPETAFRDRPWWANTRSSPQGLSWMTTSWRVEKVFLKSKIVTFRRKGVNPLTGIPLFVKRLLDESGHLAIPDPRMLANWIRFCRRVGWYFEGAILYERGGLNTDTLDEKERAEAEEDYAVCKRELSNYGDLVQSLNKGKSHA
jgi:hypothetical protein